MLVCQKHVTMELERICPWCEIQRWIERNEGLEFAVMKEKKAVAAAEGRVVEWTELATFARDEALQEREHAKQVERERDAARADLATHKAAIALLCKAGRLNDAENAHLRTRVAAGERLSVAAAAFMRQCCGPMNDGGDHEEWCMRQEILARERRAFDATATDATGREG